MENLGVPFEHYRICEFDKHAVTAYNAIHGTDFETSDVTKIHADDLGIVDTDTYTYIMTYSFPCTDLSKAGKQKGMSREEAIEACCGGCNPALCSHDCDEVAAIREIPAADVSPVVRRKDCVHYIRGKLFGDMVCDYHYLHQYHAEPNEYCSHGEKREES